MFLPITAFPIKKHPRVNKPKSAFIMTIRIKRGSLWLAVATGCFTAGPSVSYHVLPS